MRAAPFRRRSTPLLQQPLDPCHRGGKILVWAGPARRKKSGRAVERVHGQSGIIGKRRKSRRLRRGDRLDRGVRPKTVAGFFRLVEAKFAGRYRRDTVWRQQFTHLREFSRIVGRDDEL